MLIQETIDFILSEISRPLPGLDTERFMSQVSEIICREFAFLFVGLFLVDQGGELLVLRAGSGDQSESLLSLGHRMLIGEEGVGADICLEKIRLSDHYAAEEVVYTLQLGVSDQAGPTLRLHEETREKMSFFYSSFFPTARWELFLPLRVGENVIGALWVVVDKTQPGLTKEDIANLQLLADEIATQLERLASEEFVGC